jgi:hypothetical protein
MIYVVPAAKNAGRHWLPETDSDFAMAEFTGV